MIPRLLEPQAAPIAGTGDVWADIIPRIDDPSLRALCEARRQQGIDRYGVPLQLNNGRSAAIDGLQEALDGMAYSWQRVLEGRQQLEMRAVEGMSSETEAWVNSEVKIVEACMTSFQCFGAAAVLLQVIVQQEQGMAAFQSAPADVNLEG